MLEVRKNNPDSEKRREKTVENIRQSALVAQDSIKD